MHIFENMEDLKCIDIDTYLYQYTDMYMCWKDSPFEWPHPLPMYAGDGI